MAARVEFGFDGARLSDTPLILVDDGGTPFYVFLDSAGVAYNTTASGGTVVDTDTAYCHTDISSVVRGGEYSDFATAVKAALDGGSSAHGAGLTYTVTWSGATYSYTISAGGNFDLTFDAPARNILGFSADVSSASSYSSDRVPYYVLVSEHGGITEPTDDQYAEGRSKGAVSMSGEHYAIRSTGVTTQYDFKLPFESYEKTFAHQGNGTAPDGSTPVVWKYQDAIDHAGAVEPFVLVTDTESIVMTLRPDGDAFLPEREAPNSNLYWTWPFRAYRDGRL